MNPISVNAHARPVLERLLQRAEVLGLAVATDAATGVRLVDAGLHATGSVEAGLQIARLCLAGLGEVTLRGGVQWPSWVEVSSAQPVLACLASQYAGWSLSASKEETGGRRFFALGSGPARALAVKEPLYETLGYRDRAEQGALVLEVDRLPPEVVLRKVLRDCGLPPDGLTVVITPTTSRAGTTQVVARVLEVALHKAHELGFALEDIVEGHATAPLPPPHPDGVQAMGRTNDAILYGGRAHLLVRGSDDEARELAARLPSITSPDHGRPFAEIFRAAEFDFYRIDKALFAPAEVWVGNVDTGATFHGGASRLDLLLPHWRG